MAIRVTVWNENLHERIHQYVRDVYPETMHGCIRDFLATDEELIVRTTTFDSEESGLPDSLLNDTDVLLWWGHGQHELVPDELVDKIYRRVVQEGMGFIALHSAHMSKPFRRLTGMPCTLTWGREQKAVVWNVLPTHPIMQGVPLHFELFEEIYGEPFAIPVPDELLFITWYEEGNVFRGGATWHRGLGKVVYLHPGHESVPSFRNEHVQRIIRNAVHWAANTNRHESVRFHDVHQTAPIVSQD